jgi:TrmH family RNA methyltransferase
VPVQPIKDAILARIAPTEHGPGLLGACLLPRDADDPGRVVGRPGDALVVVAWDIQDPGSVGALVRSAAAFDAAGLVAAGGADPWNAKAVRASAGALHRLPVARDTAPEDLAERLLAAGYRLVAAAPRGGSDPGASSWKGRVALLLGSEVRGLPAEVEARCEVVTIPISALVESLSVPIAGSLLLAEAARQRRAGL